MKPSKNINIDDSMPILVASHMEVECYAQVKNNKKVANWQD